MNILKPSEADYYAELTIAPDISPVYVFKSSIWTGFAVDEQDLIWGRKTADRDYALRIV